MPHDADNLFVQLEKLWKKSLKFCHLQNPQNFIEFAMSGHKHQMFDRFERV